MNRNIYDKPQLYTNKDELLELINIHEQTKSVDYDAVKAIVNNMPIPELYGDCSYAIMYDNNGCQLCIEQVKFDMRCDCWVHSYICTLYYCY